MISEKQRNPVYFGYRAKHSNEEEVHRKLHSVQRYLDNSPQRQFAPDD